MNGVVQQYSADAETLFGWTRDDVICKMSIAWFHVPKNIPTLVPRLLREAIEKGKFEEEVTLMRKDGATFQAVLTVRPVLRDGQDRLERSAVLPHERHLLLELSLLDRLPQ